MHQYTVSQKTAPLKTMTPLYENLHQVDRTLVLLLPNKFNLIPDK